MAARQTSRLKPGVGAEFPVAQQLKLRAEGKWIGWNDGQQIFLKPDIAFAEAQGLATEQGESFSVLLATLKKRLNERRSPRRNRHQTRDANGPSNHPWTIAKRIVFVFAHALSDQRRLDESDNRAANRNRLNEFQSSGDTFLPDNDPTSTDDNPTNNRTGTRHPVGPCREPCQGF